MQKILLSVFLFFFLVSFAYSENTENGLPSLDAFEKAIKELVLSYYPKAQFNTEKQSFNFEYDTRKFMIHIPLKTGEWQEAREMKGPDKDGILGEIELRAGEYFGAAMVPQTFNHCYFYDLLLAPRLSRYNCHLYVHLYYPQNASHEFINSFVQLVNSFETFID